MLYRLIYFHRRVILRLTRLWGRQVDARNRLLALALIIGVLTALAAVVLHELVAGLTRWSQQLIGHWENRPWWQSGLMLVLPLVGLALSLLVQRVLGGRQYAKSLSPLILALDRRQTHIPLIETFNHILSSALSVGLGGSAGLEAPSVLTGAAIGSNCARFFYVDRMPCSLLVGCGAAAAISAIFDSPVAGVLFVVEVLLPEFSVAGLVPLLLSSAVATVISRSLIGNSPFFQAFNLPWAPGNVPYVFLCGVFCALVGIFVIRGTYRIGGLLHEHFTHPWSRLLVGGSALCVILMVFPSLRGTGYASVGQLLVGDVSGLTAPNPLFGWLPASTVLPVLVVTASIFVKAVASALTIESGGDGGIFAPTLFIGAFAGFAFARLLNMTGMTSLSESNFAVIGMCGVFTAVMRAPLTGIFLVAEVTGGYILLVPLMLVSAVAWVAAHCFEPQSIYRKGLAEKHLLSDSRDDKVLHRIPVRECVRKTYRVLAPTDTVDTLVQAIERDDLHDEVFAVLKPDGAPAGVLHLEKILLAMLNQRIHHIMLVDDLMEPPVGAVLEDDDLTKAMLNFEAYHLKYLPVLDRAGRLVGFLGREDVFSHYRESLRDSEEL